MQTNKAKAADADKSLLGKTVIVTAGNRGGGASVARRFATAGAKVAIIAPKEEGDIRFDEVSDTIIKAGGTAVTLQVDMANAVEIHAAVSQVHSHFGGIDILINNYSTFNFKSVLDTTPSEFNKVIGNIFATFFFSQACIPYLKNSLNPHVINISPPLDMESAKAACEHHLLFSISKYGMSFCTTGMAQECKKLGIAFNSLWQERPVLTATLESNFVSEVVRGSNRPEIYAEAAYVISLKRAKEFSGESCVDEAILLENDIDVSQYAIDLNARPVKDIFLPGADYSVLKPLLKR